MNEVWKHVPGYEDLYKVSNLGKVLSIKSGKLLSDKPGPNGYVRVLLRDGQNQKMFLLHRLVMLCFIGDSELQVDHIDRDKQNNCVSNLRYVDARENINHRFDATKKDCVSRGVRKDRFGKYVTRILLNNYRYTIGRFDTEEEASYAYKNALHKWESCGVLPQRRSLSSKYKGVCLTKSGKFLSKIVIEGVKYHLGVYDDELVAAENYKEALRLWLENKTLPNYIRQGKSSKYKFVYYCSAIGKWKSLAKIDGVKKHTGYFRTEQEAYEAKIKMENLLHN